MFGFKKNAEGPALCPSNPGIGIEGKVAFSNAEGSWTEKFDVVELAGRELRKHGHRVKKRKGWLEHPAGRFLISPQLVELQPMDNGGVRTVTTIQVNHPELFPAGVFEYQHAAGDDCAHSLSSGFDQWVQTDFVALLEALQPEPQTCMSLRIEFPVEGDRPAHVRRAVLGPVAHYMQDPPDPADGDACEEHPFCPCCLLTNSFQAFEELIELDGFYGLRLYAARIPEEDAQADCRVNGDDWEPGAEALRQYARLWPEAGFEFRKQYVVLHSLKD